MALPTRLRHFYFLLLVALFCSVGATLSDESSLAADADSDSDVSSDGGDQEDAIVDSDGLVQRNPDYESDTDASDDDEDESDDDEYDDEDEEKDEEDGKSAVNSALSKSKKGAKLLKKHRAKVTIALAVFAFRREIWMLACSLLTDRTRSGQRRMKPVSTTSILKILLFVDFMRKLQSPGGEGERPSSPLGALFGGTPAMLSHLLRPMNPAYVPPVEQHYTFERINDRYLKDSLALIKAWDPPRRIPEGAGDDQGMNLFGVRSEKRNSAMVANTLLRRADGAGGAGGADYNSTAIILDLTSLDTSVSRMQLIRDEISFLLSHHREMTKFAKRLGANMTNITDADQSVLIPSIEVIVLLESPGGSASDYGLAAQQIGRLRDEPGVKVTICVDKVAASGGYMMACMSSPGQLYAAPFAVLGSIGVIGQAINIHNTLQNWGVRPLVFRGGKDKAPVGMIGEVTKEGMAKVQGMVDKTHNAFKRHVCNARPVMTEQIDAVATGDVWLGADALEVGLVDRLITSDEYIGERILEGARVLKLKKHERKIHFPFSGPGRHPLGLRAMARESRQFFSDARRLMSKVATLLDDLPGDNGDISTVAAARAYGVNNVNMHTK